MIRSLSWVVSTAMAAFAGAGGHTIGNPSDSFPHDRGAAWFIDDKEFSYCLQADPAFGSNSALKDLIEDAFLRWERYLKQRRVQGPSTRRTYTGPCTGGEDLSFYFGPTPAALQNSLSHFSDPVALAERISFDPKTGQGRGVIWISPPSPKRDWSRPQALATILTHEIGHALGCGHVEGTILSEQIYGRVFAGQHPLPVPTIDGNRELLHCSSCDIKATGHLFEVNPFESKRLFKKFTGRDAVGAIRAEFRKSSGLTFDEATEALLIFSDDKGSTSLTVTLRPLLPSLTLSDATLFKTFKQNDGEQARIRSYRNFSGFGDGSIRDAQGHIYSLLLEYNLSQRGYVTLSFFEEPGAPRKTLFSSLALHF